MSLRARCLTLEQLAHNDGYDQLDNCGTTPYANSCIPGAPSEIHSAINMERVRNAITSTCGIEVAISTDPGRYICDFIHYCSLNVNRGRTAFVHVPQLNNRYSAEKLAEAVYVGISCMLEEIGNREFLPNLKLHPLKPSPP